MSPQPSQAALWVALALGAGASAAALRSCHVPGAVLLGPMGVALFFALAGARLKLRPGVMLIVQALLGCMVASAVTGPLLALVAQHWLVVLGANLLSIVAACAVAVLLTRAGWLPGHSAIWGLSPGAASTMMMMGEAHGEDPRVIALMQNLRIVAVTLTATAVAALLGDAAPSGAPPALLNAAWSLQGLLTLIALAAAGVAVAAASRRAQAAFWVPALGGSVLNATGLCPVAVPAAVAAVAFGLGGCYAGLRFDRRSLAHCVRLLPAMLLGIALLILACLGLMGLVLQSFDGIGPLTAFLAIMPGGIDAAVAIAQGLDAALPVIVAVQVMRLVVVSLAAPRMARLVAGLAPKA